jgi:hypothetical protein
MTGFDKGRIKRACFLKIESGTWEIWFLSLERAGQICEGRVKIAFFEGLPDRFQGPSPCGLSLLLIKHVCVLILQQSRFFVEFVELISLIGLSYSSNNGTISMTICVEVRIFSQIYLLHEMLHNLGVQLLYFVSFFS